MDSSIGGSRQKHNTASALGRGIRHVNLPPSSALLSFTIAMRGISTGMVIEDAMAQETGIGVVMWLKYYAARVFPLFPLNVRIMWIYYPR
jgi:hypothetical protein